MSVWAKKWAYEQRVGNSGAKAVLVALAEFAGEDGYVYPSQKTLAAMTEIKERTVRAHLAYLEEKKFIRRDSRRGEGGKWTSDGHTLLAPATTLRPPTPASTQDSPAAKSAGGKIRQRQNLPPVQRQDLPAAKSAAKPLIESDEPSEVEPSGKYIRTPHASRLGDLLPERKAEIEELHAHYCASVEESPLDAAATRTLNRALGEKGLVFCKKVIDGCALDDWPDRKFNNSIQFIFKDSERMSRLEKIARQKKNGAGKGNNPQSRGQDKKQGSAGGTVPGRAAYDPWADKPEI